MNKPPMFRYLAPLLLFFLVLSNLVFGQSANYTQFKAGTDINCQQIYSIFEDSKGNIWVGAGVGLFKYNGEDFQLFSQNEEDPFRMVFEIGETENGNIWVANPVTLGLVNEDSLQNKFKKIYLHNILTSSVIRVTSLKKNVSIITTAHSGTFEFSPKGLKPLHSTKEFQLFAENKKLRISYNHQLSDTLVDWKHIKTIKKFKVCEFSDSITYFSVNEYLFKFNSAKNEAYKITKAKNIILELKQNKKGELLILEREFNGIRKLDFKTNRLIPIFQHEFKNKLVTSILQAYEGGYWISTISNGLFYFPNYHIKSVNHERIDKTPVTKVTNNQSAVFIATSLSYIAEFKQGKVTTLADFNNEFRDFTCDQSGNLISVSYGAGVRNLSKKKLLANKSNFSNLFWGDDNNLYGRSKHRIDKIEEDTIVNLYTDDYIINTSAFYNDTIFINLKSGLHYYSVKDNTMGPYLTQFPELNKPLNEFYSFRGVKVFMNNKGVFILNQNKISELNDNKNLPIKQAFHCFINQDNTLWVSGTNGLYRIRNFFNEQKKEITLIELNNGLNSGAIQNACQLNDTIYLATSQGVNYFHKDIEITPIKPRLFLDSISVNRNQKPLFSTYNLSHNEDNIRVDFHGISLKATSPLNYQYRLLPNDSRWINGKNSFVILSALSPGSYDLEIRVTDQAKRFESKIERITFNIDSPIYQKASFIILIALFAILILYWSMRRRLNRIKQQQALTEELNIIKQQALSSQMNPHFIFNSLNSIQKYVLTNDRKNTNKYLTTFARLMRRILDNSQEQLIPLRDEIETLRIYMELEVLRFKNKLNFEIIIEESINVDDYKVPPLLFQPYVENAIWHGIMHKKNGNGLLKINFKPNQNEITCIIEDNGIGREKAQEIKNNKSTYRKSVGMEITKKRMDIIEQLFAQKFLCEIIDLKNNKMEATGTRVVIKIPQL